MKKFVTFLLASLILFSCDMLQRGDYSDYLARINSLLTYSLSYSCDYPLEGGAVPVDREIYIEGKAAVIRDQGSMHRNHYTFDHWVDTVDGSAYYADDLLTFPARHVVLESIWEENLYTLSFNGNGNTGGTLPESVTSTHFIEVEISSDEPVKDGYYFSGWNTKADGSGASYSFGTAFNLNSDLRLYAVWSSIPVNIVLYEGNGNTGGSVPAAVYKQEGRSIQIADAGSMNKAFYKFTSWNTSEGGDGISYSPGASYAADEDLTLYAQWNSLGDSSDNPYPIGSAEEFLNINWEGDALSRHYILTSDIDLGLAFHEPIGASATNAFTGSFDGDGHTISNYVINTIREYAGFFGRVENGGDTFIRNLNLKDYIIDLDSANTRYVGALVAYQAASTQIAYNSAEGYITVNNMASNLFVGGLVGASYSGSYIQFCYAKGSINLPLNQTSVIYAGGLAGNCSSTYVRCCYSTMSIYAVESGLMDLIAGGLIGNTTAYMNDYNYATGSIFGGEHSGKLGGLFGQTGSSNIVNSLAFGKLIESSEASIRRISGTANSTTFTNNYAYSGMVTGGVPDSSLTGADGLDVEEAFLGSSDALELLNDNGWSPWELQSGALRPTLTGVGDDDGRSIWE